MATSAPTRIDEDLFAAARAAGEVMSRSAAQQINHWARIGRELESSETVSHRDIARVLAGRGSYDDLTAREQAVVRAEWDERMAELRTGLDFGAEFTAQGETWAEADAQGRTVERGAEGAPNTDAARRGRERRGPR